MSLIKKHEQFAKEYIVDLNGTQAAIRAGYSSHTAHVQASKLLRHPKVKIRVQQLMDARSESTKVNSEYVISTITSTIKRCEDMDKPDNANILRGLELLGRHLKLFTDKVEVTGDYNSMSDAEVSRELAAAQQENDNIKAETEEVKH